MDLSNINILKSQGWSSIRLKRASLENYFDIINPDDEGWTEITTIRRMITWCNETFEAGTWFNSNREFIFANRKDLTLFLLKWHDYV